MVQVYTNHIGYDCADTKSAVFRRKAEENPVSFSILLEDTEKKVIVTGDRDGATCHEFGQYVIETVNTL